MLATHNIVDSALTVWDVLADSALLVFVLRRRIFTKLSFLAVYVVLYIFRDIPLIWLTHSALITTRFVFFFYHISSFSLYFVRLFILYEICWRVLRAYGAVWHYAWRVLAILSAGFFFWMAASARLHFGHPKALILTASRQFSIMQAVLLLLILAIGIYYQISISRFFKLVLIGSCVYSAVEITNSAYGMLVRTVTYSFFDVVQRVFFLLMLTIWLWAIWRWSDVDMPSRAPIDQAIYDDYAPKVHGRLRELNGRLARMLGTGPQ